MRDTSIQEGIRFYTQTFLIFIISLYLEFSTKKILKNIESQIWLRITRSFVWTGWDLDTFKINKNNTSTSILHAFTYRTICLYVSKDDKFLFKQTNSNRWLTKHDGIWNFFLTLNNIKQKASRIKTTNFHHAMTRKERTTDSNESQIN